MDLRNASTLPSALNGVSALPRLQEGDHQTRSAPYLSLTGVAKSKYCCRNRIVAPTIAWRCGRSTQSLLATRHRASLEQL